MASEPSAQPWCLHNVRHSTTIKRIDMSKNPILFRTPATAVDGESVEPRYVQFELSHEGLKSWQEKCEIFKTREWLQRSEENTSELQSLMSISYAVFCLKKKK